MAKITGSANQDNNQSIKRQNFIKNFRQKYPNESKSFSDVQIISIMDNKIDDIEYRDNKGIRHQIEITPWVSDRPRNDMVISSSGRYSIFDRKNEDWDGKFYAADGTRLKKDYYKKVEEDYRMNQPVTESENNKSIYVSLSNYRGCSFNDLIEQNLNRISNVITKAEKENGLFASLWSGIKNKTGFGDSSNKAKEQLEKERQIIKEKGYVEGFKELTGLTATPKNIEDFKNGKVKLKSEQLLDAYKEGQEMAVDIEGDLVSGALAFTVYSLAVTAAPFTAGASIAVGAAAAATVGAITKPMAKGMASAFGGYNYEMSKKDFMTGAFSGALAPISAGLGGAVGKVTAKALGVEAVKHIGKKGIEQTAKAGLKETITTGLLNPAGYKYTANSFIRRETALASELVTDGITAGTIDGGFRAGVENKWQLKEMGKGALMGAAGGFVLSPVIGRTMKSTGSAGHYLGLPMGTRMKFYLQDKYNNASPMQKKIIEEILSSEALQKQTLLSYNYQDIINPNSGKLDVLEHIRKIIGDDYDYFNKSEVEELLAARLKIIRQLKESPELDNTNTNHYILSSLLADNNKFNVERIKSFSEMNLAEVVTRLESLKKQMLEHPQMYISGDYPDTKAREIISRFLFSNWELFRMASVFDGETLNSLMRRRLGIARDYMDTFVNFTSGDVNVLKHLCSSTDVTGKAFTPNQKVEFIDLINGFKENKLDVSLINGAIKDGKVNLTDLHKILLNKVFKNIGLTDAEIASVKPEKMSGWDFKNIHLLAKSIVDSEDETYHDLIRASVLDDFMRYLHDGANDYGKANLKTKEIFEQKGWDYDAYIKPNKENEVKLGIKDKNTEQLTQSGANFVNIIERLMQPPLDKIVKKQLVKYLKDDKFVIPEDVLSSKDKLHKFMAGVLKNLENIKKRAEGNLTNPEIDEVRRQNAKNTMTKFSDLQRVMDNVEKINTEKNTAKDYNLTIKMIDRVPQKDIFQGNYSTCCIGQGEFNERAMAHYLMNTSYNMIELVDNESGKTIGNALCYFVEENKTGMPYFIIDNIEINNAYRCSDEAGKEIRNAITEYASKVVKQVTGKEDLHICMSDNYNDVPTSDLRSQKIKIKFVGDVETKHQYMDLFGGWESDFKGRCNMQFLR